MFKKDCPWCHHKITLTGLGTRPKYEHYKWYEFSRAEKVCPYCAKPVKLGGKKAKYMSVLVLPLFSLMFVDMFFGGIELSTDLAFRVAWGFALVGIFGFALLSKFEPS